MTFPINDFVQYIPQTILDRGLHYFLDGKVVHIPSTSPDSQLARVDGTLPYEVTFRISDGQLMEHHCTCPFEGGEWCKHEAAFIFHLQQDRLDIKPLTP